MRDITTATESIDIAELGCNNEEWIHLIKVGAGGRLIWHMVMKFRVP